MSDDWRVHIKNMRRAVNLAKLCRPEDSRKNHPKVGVVVDHNGELTEAYRGQEEPGEHGEYTALVKRLGVADGVELPGATLYTTLEPCTSRMHPKRPCYEWILQAKIDRVFVGILDPNPRICGTGEWILKHHGVKVDRFPSSLQQEIESDNRQFIDEHTPHLLKKVLNLRRVAEVDVHCKYCNEPHALSVPVIDDGGTNRVITCNRCNRETVAHFVGDAGSFFTDPTGEEPHGVTPAQGLSLRDAMNWQFKRSQFRVKPEQLRGLFKLMRDTEIRLKAENQPVTPKKLVEAMRTCDELHCYHVKKKAIHELINYLVLWGYFEFETLTGPKFHRPYKNEFIETDALRCYLKAALSILRRNGIVRDVEGATEASRLLVGGIIHQAAEFGREVWTSLSPGRTTERGSS